MPMPSKLTEEQKKAIRWYHICGAQPKALAIAYGVSATTISLILHPEAYERKKAYMRERARKRKEARLCH